MCEDTSKFSDAPYPAITLGADGSILMYLTHRQNPNEEMKELKSVRNADYGDRINFVPKTQIKQVLLRHKKDA
jgi:hypothetical protein